MENSNTHFGGKSWHFKCFPIVLKTVSEGNTKKEDLFCLGQSQPGLSSQTLGCVSEAEKVLEKAAEGPGTWIFASVWGGCSLATDRGKLDWKLLQVWGVQATNGESCSKKQKQSKKLPAANSSWWLQLISGPANIDDNVISETWEVFIPAISTISVSGVSLLSLVATFTASSSSPWTNCLKLMKADF